MSLPQWPTRNYGLYAAMIVACVSLGQPLLPAAEPAATVRMVIDYGDGVEKHFTALAWQAEMTVLDALQAAKRHPRGIVFEHRGSGATTLLTKIDDVENEGRGRNWLFRVNDELGDRSCGIFVLKQGDAVLWKFDKSR